MYVEQKLIQGVAAPLPMDHRAMIAALLALQGTGAVAAAQIDHDVARSIAHSLQDAIAALMQARPGWKAAAGVLGGSFHRGVATLVAANGM